MRHGAGAAPPRSRYIGAASLFLLGSSLFLFGIFVLGFAASRAVAGGPLAPDVGTETTPTAATTAPTAPAPDPKPPIPNPDPKPGRVQRKARVAPPPPPPPSPAPARRNASRQPATRKAPAPARRAEALRRARKAAAQKEAAAALAARRARRLRAARPAKQAKRAARAKVVHPKPVVRAKPVVRTKRVARTERRRVHSAQAAAVISPTPPPVLGPRLAASEDAGSGALPLVAPILGLGLIALGAAAVSPRLVPWPAVAQPLRLHRTDLAVAGVGLIGFALLALNVIVVL